MKTTLKQQISDSSKPTDKSGGLHVSAAVVAAIKSLRHANSSLDHEGVSQALTRLEDLLCITPNQGSPANMEMAVKLELDAGHRRESDDKPFEPTSGRTNNGLCLDCRIGAHAESLWENLNACLGTLLASMEFPNTHPMEVIAKNGFGEELLCLVESAVGKSAISEEQTLALKLAGSAIDAYTNLYHDWPSWRDETLVRLIEVIPLLADAAEKLIQAFGDSARPPE